MSKSVDELIIERLQGMYRFGIPARVLGEGGSHGENQERPLLLVVTDVGLTRQEREFVEAVVVKGFEFRLNACLFVTRDESCEVWPPYVLDFGTGIESPESFVVRTAAPLVVMRDKEQKKKLWAQIKRVLKKRT